MNGIGLLIVGGLLSLVLLGIEAPELFDKIMEVLGL